jgi:hypothetical protein
MRNRYAKGQRAAALAGLLALALVAGPGRAWAQDDEQEPLDTRLFRSFMKEMGFKRGDEGIDYRERAPLVVPPTRNLPPPQTEGPAASNPAWPKDPDVARRKQASAAEKAKLYSSAEEQARVLRPDELKPQGQPTAGASTSERSATGPTNSNEATRPLSPSELQGTATKHWWDFFSSVGPSRPESAPFKGEPPRTTMTAPPPGYQTPSPSYPYGLGVQRGEVAKPSTVESRMEPAR